MEDKSYFERHCYNYYYLLFSAIQHVQFEEQLKHQISTMLKKNG